MLAYRHDGEKEGRNMAMFQVTVTEIHKGKFDIEAETAEEAQEKFEAKYWSNPNDYLLEPEDTSFEADGPTA